ncbi:MAG: response regulator [Planctomycetaceae bacterium]|jgi:CheY-like chemotaxis protein|nr:response regulator [Planctomycetaceae bacterium]
MSLFPTNILVLVIVAAVLFKTLQTVRSRKNTTAVYQYVTWFIFILVIVADSLVTNHALQSAKNYIQADLAGFAKLFAVSLQEMDYEKLTPEVNNADPFYLKLLTMTEVWQKNSRGYVASVYTVRENEQGKLVFVLCPAADLNRDKQILGWREQQISNGTVYDTHSADIREIRRAFKGMDSCSAKPQKDEWGYWITAAHPIYSKAGRIVGVLAIDFWGEDWDYVVFCAELFPQLLFFPCLVLFFTVDIFLLKRYALVKQLTNYASDLERSVESLGVERRYYKSAVQGKMILLAGMVNRVRTPICKLSKELTVMLDDILTFVQVDAKRLVAKSVPVELRWLINEVYESTLGKSAEKVRDRFNIHYSDNVPHTLISDPALLRKMFADIIGNAVRFAENGNADINISLLQPDEGASAVSTGQTPYPSQPFSHLMYTSLIISPQERKSSRQQMFSDAGVSAGGQPLLIIDVPCTDTAVPAYESGLEAVRGLAQLMGGNMFFNPDEIGSGKKFSVYLPCVSSGKSVSARTRHPVHTINHHSSSPALPLHPLRVLNADGSVANQLAVEAKLHDAGAEAESAANGQIAVNRVLEGERNGAGFDAVVMNVQMPVVDGITAAKELRSNGFLKPIVAVTASPLDSRAYSEIFDAVLEKPFDADDLVKAISACVCEKGGVCKTVNGKEAGRKI